MGKWGGEIEPEIRKKERRGVEYLLRVVDSTHLSQYFLAPKTPCLISLIAICPAYQTPGW